MSNINLKNEFESKTYNSKIKIFEHSTTKTQIINVLKDDPENTFIIGFKTAVASSKGFAHILEHSVLSGSKNYPVKEPFLELLKTSIATYINASTYSEKTLYPVSSTNLQDHLNLMGVYLDAVFEPNISEQTLMREGWHLHLESINDKIKFQGVVFNEMKGALGDFDHEIYEKYKTKMFEDTFLKYTSGGTPEEILKLSYEEFLKFYKDHYHPSNSVIMLYGDHEITEKLELIESYLNKYDYKNPENLELNDSDYTSKKVEFLPIDSNIVEEKPDYFTYCYGIKLVESTNYLEKIKISVVNSILMSSMSSKLWSKLSELDICEEIFPLSDGLSFESSFQKTSFGFALKNIKIDDIKTDIADYAKQKTKIIHKLLSQIEQEKFSKLEIESTLNQFDFYFRELFNKTNGRRLSIQIIEDFFYGGGLNETFKLGEIFESVKQSYKEDDQLFDNVYKKYFVENTNVLELFLVPDKKHLEDHKAKEDKYLGEVFDKNNEKQVLEVIESTKSLIESNKIIDTKENLDKLPRLKITDLNRVEEITNFDIIDNNKFDLLKFTKDSNGILYALLAFDISFLDYEIKKNISSFVDILDAVGTDKFGYQELAQKIDFYFGSLSFDILMEKDLNGENQEYLTISFRCLETYFENCIILIKEIIFNSKPTKERLNYLLGEKKSGILSGVLSGERGYLSAAIQSQFDSLDQLIEHNYGLKNLDNLEKFLGDFDYFSSLFKNFKNLFNFKPVLSLAGSDNLITSFSDLFESMFEFDEIKNKKTELEFDPSHHNLIYKAPIDVNFIVFGGQVDVKKEQYEYGLIANILSKYYLWNEIRIAGGAYGSGVAIDRIDKFIAFNSYRDPNFDKTIEIFKNTPKFLSQIDQEMLEKAKISTIGKLDFPKTTSQMPYFIFNDLTMKTDNNFRQKRRDSLFEIDLDKIKATTNTIEKALNKGIFAAFVPESQIKKSQLLKAGEHKVINLFKN